MRLTGVTKNMPVALSIFRQRLSFQCHASLSKSKTRGLARAAKSQPVVVNEDSEEELQQKAAALRSVMENLNKKHGKNTIMFADEWQKFQGPTLKTGVLTLDIALGGGWPKGRIIEVFGPESSGKSTLCLATVKELLKQPNKMAALVDAEHAFDLKFAKSMGIDTERLIVTKTESGEAAMDGLLQLINSSSVDLVIVDSVANLIPKMEVEAEFGAPTMGSHARLMSSGLKKIVTAASTKNVTVIFTNQIRYKIGVMFGNPETTTGGKALHYYSSVRVDLRKTKKITGGKKGDGDVGVKIRAKIVKCKTAAPFKEAEFDILWDRGVDEIGCVFDAGMKSGVINARGSHYYVGDDKLGQGRDSVVEMLKHSQEKLEELKDLVHKAITEETDESVLLQSAPEEFDFDDDGNLITESDGEVQQRTIEA